MVPLGAAVSLDNQGFVSHALCVAESYHDPCVAGRMLLFGAALSSGYIWLGIHAQCLCQDVLLQMHGDHGLGGTVMHGQWE